MNDTAIRPYVRLALIRGLTPEGWPDGFQRKSDFQEALRNLVTPALERYNPPVSTKLVENVLRELLDQMIEENILARDEDEFAGEYLKIRAAHIERFRDTQWSNNSLSKRANAIGIDRFFADVFAGFRAQTGSPDSSAAFDAAEFDFEDFETGENPTPVATDELTISSIDWTGSLDRAEINEATRVKIVSRIKSLQEVLDTADLDQTEKSQAGAMLAAAIALSEAPDPPWKLIQQILILLAAVSSVFIGALEIAKLIG